MQFFLHMQPVQYVYIYVYVYWLYNNKSQLIWNSLVNNGSKKTNEFTSFHLASAFQTSLDSWTATEHRQWHSTS